MKMLIIADDLSGAADCAAGCAQTGLRTLVALDGEADPAGFAVVAVDADSRRLPAVEAAAAQRALLERWLASRPSLLYKKIDSTLRGSFAEELAATRHLTGMPIIAPAFPATGRTVVNGQVLVKGVLLQETEIWRNERRAGPAALPDLLRAAGFEPAVLSLTELRGDSSAVRASFAAHAAAPNRVLICDAESEDDLARIAQGSAPLAGRCQWVGSGGLMRHLPAAHGLGGQAVASQHPRRGLSGPVLVVVGSVSSVSQRQRQQVAQAAQTMTVTIDPNVLRQGANAGDGSWREARQRLLDPLLADNDLVVTIGGTQPDLREGPLLAAALARLLEPARTVVGGLILTGGETARAILTGWGVHALELVGELEAGIPLSYTLDARPVPVITKAGAFGADDSLARAWRLLKFDC